MLLDEKNILKNIIEFKNDLLKKINSLESRILNKVRLYEKDFSSKLDNLSEKMLIFEQKFSNFQDNTIEIKKISEKITTLEKFKLKAESALLTQNIRLNTSLEDIEKIKTKYDKIFIENLTIPGFVGNSCKYKNLPEYIIHNMKEKNRNKIKEEEMNNDIISMKQKISHLQYTFTNFINTMKEKNNENLEKNTVNLNLIFEKKLKDISDKIGDIKMKDMETRMNFEKHLNEFRLFTDDVYEIKEIIKNMENIHINNTENIMIKNNDLNNLNILKNNEKNKVINYKEELTKDNNEIIKILNKIMNEKGVKDEKIMLNTKNNEINILKEEISEIKNIIKSELNGSKNKNSNLFNKLNAELNQIKINIKESIKDINSKISNLNFNIPPKIQVLNKQQENFFSNFEKEKEREKEKSITKNLLNLRSSVHSKTSYYFSKNISKANIINKNKSKEDFENYKNNFIDNKNKNNNISFDEIENNNYNNKFSNNTSYRTKKDNNIFNKRTNYIKININNKKNDKNLEKSLKNNSLSEEDILSSKNINQITKINKCVNCENLKKNDKLVKILSPTNKSGHSSTVNLSINNIENNKGKQKRELLSPIVDSLYKEYYRKKISKEKKEDNGNKNDIYIVKKLVPAFGRTNYESY